MITYRDLVSLDDLQACIDLQVRVWGFDPVDVVPLPILLITGKYGGFLHGAFDGDRLVGFVYSLPARGLHRWLQWSHMLAVDPAYQGMGVGVTLKFRQKAFAQTHGYDLVAWTFDPLEVKNAYFNFEKLGVVARLYEPNVYGVTTSRLHWQLPTDRLVAEWWVIVERDALWPGRLEEAYPRIPDLTWQDGRPYPLDVPVAPWPETFWTPVPPTDAYPADWEAARSYRALWQKTLREVLTRAFSASYVAVRFARTLPDVPVPAYLIVHSGALRQPLPDW